MKSLPDNKIAFNFTYYAMKLLGKNLYSSPWTAVSEIVANGIDAGAEEVYVYVDMCDKKNSVVEIFDKGTGMSESDLREKYALIGRNKRVGSDNVEGKTLGRKGIGKLAALYLSPRYILSTKTVSEESVWEVDTSKFKDSDIPTLDKLVSNSYQFAAKEYWDKFETGTMIHLTNVDLTNIGEEKIKKLPQILADYYLPSVIGCRIFVCVQDKHDQAIAFQEIKKRVFFETMYSIIDTTGNYSRCLNNKVYLTEPGDYPIVDYPRDTVVLNPDKFECVGTIEMENLQGQVKAVPYELKGWLGIHTSLKKSVLLRNVKDEKEYTLRPNTIRLYVRGKLAVDNLMNYIGSTQALAKYIEGDLVFDILDDDEFEDSSTSSREGYTLTDPRVVKLIDIAGKLCSALLQERSRIGTQINKERNAYLEKLREEEKRKREQEEALRKKSETERDVAVQARNEAQEELKQKKVDLGSEKRRNSFLKSSLSEDQITYSKRLHMVKINCSTIKSIISGLVAKKKRDILTLDAAWDGIQKISYNIERTKAVLEYYAIAEFDPKDEKVDGDMYAFIKEYCHEVAQKVCDADDHEIEIIVKANANYHRSFVPQNIGVIIENVVNNSYKNKAKTITFDLYIKEGQYCIDVIDDGAGLNPSADAKEVFEFGKSYTKYGTGVGLYHVKQIVDEMGGKISINTNRKSGFELQMRFEHEV